MKVTNAQLLKKIIKAAEPAQDEITFAEKMYALWVSIDVTDEQAQMLERAKNCGPDRVANTKGECI